MYKVYIGIDPGLDGAIAIIHLDGTASVHDMPTTTTVKAHTKHRDVDEYKLANLIGRAIKSNGAATADESFAVIEKAQSAPGQGVASMFSYGVGYGKCRGVLAANGIPQQDVRPQEWMATMFSGIKEARTKKLSIKTALRLFPDAEIHLQKHHGRAEALLIAEWARRTDK